MSRHLKNILGGQRRFKEILPGLKEQYHALLINAMLSRVQLWFCSALAFPSSLLTSLHFRMLLIPIYDIKTSFFIPLLPSS